MAEIKWIKITTTMFDDEKIDYIESLPEADTILIIWIKLLTLAGKCNAGGYVFLTESIPYTEEMLSHRMRRPTNTVKLALATLESLGMIKRDMNGICISNWEKHQNVEGMERIREQARLRMQRWREKQKLLSSDVTVTQRYETDIDIEQDIEQEVYKRKSRAFTPPSLQEVSDYCNERNNGIDPQHFIDFYSSKGWKIGKNKMKDWKAAVRTWEARRKEENEQPPRNSGKNKDKVEPKPIIDRTKFGYQG